MNLKTKLVSSYAIIISFILTVFMIWYFDDILRVEQRYTELTSEGMQKVMDKNYAISKEILSKYGKRTLRASSDLLALELAEMLKDRDCSDYTKLRQDEELRKLATQIIETADGIEIGHFDVHDDKGVAVLHSNREIEGKNYSEWKEQYPEMWKLVEDSIATDGVEGDYTFIEEDKSSTANDGKKSRIVDKFLYTNHIPGTNFILCSAVNKEKYYTSVHNEIRAAGNQSIGEIRTVIHDEESGVRFKAAIWALLGFIILLVGGIGLGYFVSHKISKPLMDLCKAVDIMGKGDFSVKLQLPEKTFTEMKTLTDNFNALGGRLMDYTERLKNEITAREAIEGELKAAKRIQESLLPGKNSDEFKIPADIELFATLEPAKNVSGDFYDYFYIADNKAVLIMADVSGKGIPAALFMAVSRTLIRVVALNETVKDTSIILETANDFLCRENDSCMFVTLFLCICDFATGEITFSNAGHNPPIIFDPAGNPQEIGNFRNMPLGVEPDSKYEHSSITLDKGSTMLLYTDGITEAMSPDIKLYGYEGLLAFFKENITKKQSEISKKLLAELDKFQHGKQFDDITFLMLKRK